MNETRRRRVPEVRRRARRLHPRALLRQVPRAARAGRGLSDEQLDKLQRGGHDPVKVYAAYKAAVEHKGTPTVILAKTVKGYGLGEAGEGRNITHQQKKLNEDELRIFRDRFDIPISDEELAEAPFYKPADDSPEMQYLHERRNALGGSCRSRRVTHRAAAGSPTPEILERFSKGVDRDVSTTMVFVQHADPAHEGQGDRQAHRADHARRGAHLRHGVAVPPVRHLLPRRPALRAGRQATCCSTTARPRTGRSWRRASPRRARWRRSSPPAPPTRRTAINMIPFYIFYSMFGFQRVGDLIWAAADSARRGFLLGATAGRTTLNGEGLQHEDGHSHVLASTVPNLRGLRPGLRLRDRGDHPGRHAPDVPGRGEHLLLHHPLQRELPDAADAGGRARRASSRGCTSSSGAPERPDRAGRSVHLFGSGSLLREALRAQEILAERYGVAADVWSVTSYKELRRDALEAERWNLLHPDQEPRKPYVRPALRRGRRPSSPSPTT